jgi:8-oxo-dGTP pyrophosphatase MutT (NUDIX family)
MLTPTAAATTASSRCHPVRGDEQDADNDPDGGPDVGEEVLAVGLERHRSVGTPGAHEQDADRTVHQRRHDRDREPEPHALDGLRVNEPVDRADDDDRGRREDHEAFEAGGEVLGLAVAVVVVRIGRARRDVQGDERHHRGDQVHERLGRVREQTHRSGDEVRPRLQADRHQRRRDRQPGEAGQTRRDPLGLLPDLGQGETLHAVQSAPAGLPRPVCPGRSATPAEGSPASDQTRRHGPRAGRDGRSPSLWPVAKRSLRQADPVPRVVPRVPASASGMIFDDRGRLLVLNPTYKSGWTLPGGEMEATGETPWEACRREAFEECGLVVDSARLAAVDFRRPKPGSPGGVRFLFDCGVVDGDQLGHLVLQPMEISEYRLVPLPEALTLLRKAVRRRVAAALAAGGFVYLEQGRRVDAVG